MYKCKGCKSVTKKGFTAQCVNCGEIYCEPCANKTKNICPKCYHNIEIIG